MQIFKESLFFKLRTTIQQKTVKPTYLVSINKSTLFQMGFFFFFLTIDQISLLLFLPFTVLATHTHKKKKQQLLLQNINELKWFPRQA